MPWKAGSQRYWTVCRKWGVIPYPCRKTRTVYCCTGRWKQRCYVLYGEHWICCNRSEYHYWAPCFGLGDTISERETVCRTSIPSESRDGCPTTGDDAPPGVLPGSSLARALIRIGLGSGLGAAIGVAIALATGSATRRMAIGGLIVGAVFGWGSGRKWGGVLTLILLIAVIVVLSLVPTG
jgi:hypothetical protein